jgi:hypothetical protein
VIVVGDKVDLVGEKGRLYRTMIEDVTENVLYLVGVPSHGGIPMLLHVDEEVFMVFYRESGRYIARFRVAGFEKKGEIRYAMLLLKEKPHHDQRREAYRLRSRMKSQICEYEDGIEMDLPVIGDIAEAVVLETVSSRDVSITGVALITKNDYMPGEKFLLRMYFGIQTPAPPPFLICAKVMRTTHGFEKDTYNKGMKFFGQTRNMHEFLSRYILDQQQKQIKQRRLVEGD